jgi:hypothetical protein
MRRYWHYSPRLITLSARKKAAEREPYHPLVLVSLLGYLPRAMAKVYIVSFRTHDDLTVKFIV